MKHSEGYGGQSDNQIWDVNKRWFFSRASVDLLGLLYSGNNRPIVWFVYRNTQILIRSSHFRSVGWFWSPGRLKNRSFDGFDQFWTPLRSENGAENRKNQFWHRFWVFRYTNHIPVGVLTEHWALNRAGDAREKKHRLLTSETVILNLIAVRLLHND